MTSPIAYPLVIGATGFVGGAVVARLGRCAGTRHSPGERDLIELDVSDPKAVVDVVSRVDPTSVVLCSAIADPDTCERDPRTSSAVNALGPLHVARVCAARDIPVVVVSTDYVFDGASGPYDETDAPNPILAYGRHKLEGEQHVLESGARALVVRTSCVYRTDPPGGGLVRASLRAVAEGLSMRLSDTQLSTPTHVDDLADGIVALLNADRRGVYHLAGPETVDRLRFAREVFASLDADQGLLSPANPEHSTSTPRPQRCGLRIERAVNDIGYRPRSIREGLVDWSEAP